MITKPDKTEYPEWFAGEIELVPYPDLIQGLEDSFTQTLAFLNSIPLEKLEYRYAAEKWTIKQIWQHILDVERILCYRALRYSRQDTTVLHGFDENRYALLSNCGHRPWDEITAEYVAVRTSTMWLFKSFTTDMHLLKGTTGKSTMTVRSVGFLVLGHEIHHVNTIKTRYLNNG